MIVLSKVNRPVISLYNLYIFTIVSCMRFFHAEEFIRADYLYQEGAPVYLPLFLQVFHALFCPDCSIFCPDCSISILSMIFQWPERPNVLLKLNLHSFNYRYHRIIEISNNRRPIDPSRYGLLKFEKMLNFITTRKRDSSPERSNLQPLGTTFL